MKVFPMIFFIIFLALQLPIFSADDAPKELDEKTRSSLILELHENKKYPCWTTSCQERYPTRSCSISNKKYDSIVDKLFAQAEEGKQDGFKEDCRTLVREGYGCWNWYRLWQSPSMAACALLNRSICQDCNPIITIPCLGIPFAAVPCLINCTANICCLQTIKTCDFQALYYLSEPDFPSIEEV